MRSPAMDPSFSGFVLDPSKCSKLSMEEKRELVYEISKWPKDAPEMLQAWSRRELLEILCAEMGKERKYTGFTKYKMIEHLLRIVSEKKAGKCVEDIDSTMQPIPSTPQTSSKRQRKTNHPSRLPIETCHLPANDGSDIVNSPLYCQNVACKASVSLEDAFCKRCSCCICYKYDDNKDPSLWLVCSSESAYEGESCGMSCHVECALKDERAGIAKNGQSSKPAGSFCCVSCGKVNDLLGCWRKQLVIAKDARRVDALCYRVCLSHNLLNGAEKYHNLLDIVDSAMKKLEVEVGPFNGLSVRMGRGIVNRLSCGADVQKLCGLAIESLDSMLSNSSHLSPDHKMQKCSVLSSKGKCKDMPTTLISFSVSSDDGTMLSEEVKTIQYQKAVVLECSTEPTHKSVSANRNSLAPELIPHTTNRVLDEATKYLLMDDSSSKPNSGSLKTSSSGLSNPSSEGNESNNSAAFRDLNELPDDYCGYCENPEIPDLEKSLDCAREEMTLSHDVCNETIICRTQVTGQEETPGHSVSALDEEPNSTIQTGSQRDSTNSTDNNQASEVLKSENESNAPIGNEMVVFPYGGSNSALPITPSKPGASKEGAVRSRRTKSGSGGPENWFPKPKKEPQIGSSSKKKGAGRCEGISNKDGSLEGNYEYCVKVIRWLECEGHVDTNFRVKFLTWFSLRATPQERKVVSVFVDTLIDDPPSLAGQLVDSFSEGVSGKRPPPGPTGFCMKLWH